MGMRSCVRDMLSLARSILEAEKSELLNTNTATSPTNCSSILPNTSQTRKGRWTRPSSGNGSLKDNTVYCMGWYRTTIPSSMLGFLSYNDMTRGEVEEMDSDFILGVESLDRELVAHNGVFDGSTSALYTFPETQSAIVAFANGLQDADAAEFAAQILAQALFDLQPEVDILALARRESNIRKQHFTDSLLSEWERNRDTSASESPKEQYVGNFKGHATIIFILQDSKTTGLCVQFNGVKESTLAPQHYGKDTYSFFPTSRDEWPSNSMFEWNHHRLALFKFERDHSDDVVGLLWQWDHEGKPSWFQKI